MPVEMNPILSKKQLAEINRGLSAINGAYQQCEVAESCGLDCSDRRVILDNAAAELNLFKRTYFPDAK